MIPGNITQAHILKAIGEVDRNGIPSNRLSTKYLLKINGKNYPPKFIVSLANKYANGRELSPQEFGGGIETNNFFRKRGFTVVP